MKKFFLYGVMTSGLMLTACSTDDVLTPESGTVLDKDQTLYVSMRISGDAAGGTRASSDNGSPEDGGTDFGIGTDQEHAINNAYFVFYDETGTVVGDIVPIDMSDMTVDTSPDGATVEQSYKSVIPVSVRKGEKKPTQVICYLNPISPSTLQQPLSRIQTVSRTANTTTVNGKTYMAMSNSVYYPDETNLKSEPQIAVPIPSDALYSTEEGAEQALGEGNTVNVYVERYAAKLAFKGKKPEDYKTATRIYNANGTQTVNPITLSFTPQYWAVNAEANTTYVIKSFREVSEAGVLLPNNYTYGTLNQYINPAEHGADNNWEYGEAAPILDETNLWNWNNPEYHRSYWGMSPAYFQNIYPEVSSDLKEMEANGITINQKYISYDELKEGKYGYTVNLDPEVTVPPRYFKETTVGSMALQSQNPAAAVASIIYVGQYSMSINGTAVNDNPGFYTYLVGPVDGVDEDRPYIYFENEDGTATSKIAQGESMLKRFFVQQTILYKRSTDEEGHDVYSRLMYSNAQDLQTLIAALNVSEISDKVKVAYDGMEDTKLKLQNNTRTLQFKNSEAASGIFILTADGYKEIVADETQSLENYQIRLTEANVILMRQVGVSYYYKTGHGYFNIPIRHLGWYRKGNTQKDLNSTAINWTLVRVGDFGLVRNHSYDIELNNIIGLASGIGDDGNPIVPPANTEDYFMAYSVRILKWALVPKQSVNL